MILRAFFALLPCITQLKTVPGIDNLDSVFTGKNGTIVAERYFDSVLHLTLSGQILQTTTTAGNQPLVGVSEEGQGVVQQRTTLQEIADDNTFVQSKSTPPDLQDEVRGRWCVTFTHNSALLLEYGLPSCFLMDFRHYDGIAINGATGKLAIIKEARAKPSLEIYDCHGRLRSKVTLRSDLGDFRTWFSPTIDWMPDGSIVCMLYPQDDRTLKDVPQLGSPTSTVRPGVIFRINPRTGRMSPILERWQRRGDVPPTLRHEFAAVDQMHVAVLFDGKLFVARA